MGAVFTREAPAIGLLVVMTQPLGEKASLDINAGGHADPNPKPNERTDLRASTSLSVEAASWLRPYAELYVRGDPTRWRDGTFTADAGLVLPVHSSVAIDVAGRVDLLARERAVAVLAGATFVVQGPLPRVARTRR
jgi:hypothetical protein